MDKISRKELKHDRFAEEVQHSVEYVESHRKQLTTYGIIAVALVVLIAGVSWYRSSQKSVRQADLREALRTQDGAVSAESTSEFIKTYKTQAEKDKAVQDAFSKLANKYPSDDEGIIAKYYLGVTAADMGKQDEAEKRFKEVADSSEKDYASLAKFALAQIYESQGKTAEAEKYLRDLAANPTILLSKEQAQIALARVISKTKPEEARKLLEPLRTERSAVSRAALSAMAELNK